MTRKTRKTAEARRINRDEGDKGDEGKSGKFQAASDKQRQKQNQIFEPQIKADNSG